VSKKKAKAQREIVQMAKKNKVAGTNPKNDKSKDCGFYREKTGGDGKTRKPTRSFLGRSGVLMV